MKSVFEAVKVSEHVYWVGAVDWTIRDFHGYLTSRGTSYNAYLVVGQKTVLLDTVKEAFREEMMARVASVVDPESIDVVISNHTEMDHSGSLPAVLERVKPEAFYASAKGAEALPQHFSLPIEPVIVKDGETLDIGGLHFAFVATPMLHWPDSMWTYLAEDALVFSNDAFGMHLAATERFADELPADLLHWEAAKYYANILLPLSPLVTKLVDRVGKLGLKIDAIAPDHGPIWRRDPMEIVKKYAAWAEQKPTRKAVIAFDTMWKSTEKMARAIGEGLAEGGATVKILPLSVAHRSDVATELLDAGALVVGSPTMNNQMFPTVADLLCYLRGLKPKNLVAAAFGSYGWSGEAVAQVKAALEEMKLDVVGEPIRSKYVPGADALLPCRELGRTIAEKLAG